MGWLIALGVLILLAILPLGASIAYNAEGFGLKIIAGPVRVRILPAKKKKEKKQKEKKTKQVKKSPAKSEPKEQKPKEKGGSITDFLPLVKTGLDLLNGFRKKLRINHLEMKLIMAGDDPCDLAVNYGKAWAALGNLMPLLEQCFVIKKRDLEVECDFESSETVVIARADLTITLGRLLCLLVRYGVRGLRQYLRIVKTRKGGAVK